MSCARGIDDEGDRRGVDVESAAALPGTECMEWSREGDGRRFIFMCGVPVVVVVVVPVRRSAVSESGEVVWSGEGEDDR